VAEVDIRAATAATKTTSFLSHSFPLASAHSMLFCTVGLRGRAARYTALVLLPARIEDDQLAIVATHAVRIGPTTVRFPAASASGHIANTPVIATTFKQRESGIASA